MSSTFLIGGGRDPEGVRLSHAPFARAAAGAAVLCVALEEEGLDMARWTGGLRAAGVEHVRPLVVSPERPPRVDDLRGVGAVYVAGGWTPGYREVVVGAREFAQATSDLPYAGFSAGAAIAAASAILGGWRLGGRQACSPDAGEDLEELTVRPGLGRVPFAVDVHATQWGTLTRAVHAVEAGLVEEALAIDEGTCVEFRGDHVHAVSGAGVAYRVRPGRLEVLGPE